MTPKKPKKKEDDDGILKKGTGRCDVLWTLEAIELHNDCLIFLDAAFDAYNQPFKESVIHTQGAVMTLGKGKRFNPSQ
jgi:hypothetical protein